TGRRRPLAAGPGHLHRTVQHRIRYPHCHSSPYLSPLLPFSRRSLPASHGARGRRTRQTGTARSGPMNFRRHQEQDSLEINLIPLIDVLLVILIFLAASTSFTRYQQMKVALPQAAAQAPEPQAIAVSVSRNGDYAVNGQALNGSSIQEIAQGLLALPRPPDTEGVL